MENLQNVFDRLRTAGLKLKPKKCDLFVKSVKYKFYIKFKQIEQIII